MALSSQCATLKISSRDNNNYSFSVVLFPRTYICFMPVLRQVTLVRGVHSKFPGHLKECFMRTSTRNTPAIRNKSWQDHLRGNHSPKKNEQKCMEQYWQNVI